MNPKKFQTRTKVTQFDYHSFQAGTFLQDTALIHFIFSILIFSILFLSYKNKNQQL